jgi:gliding motility-associated-like protein
VKTNYIKLILIVSILSIVTHTFGQSASEFIENKGQWDAPFLFKTINAQNEIFLTKTGYTVLLSDAANSEKMDEKHHGKVEGEKVLKFHSYNIEFLNSNPNVQFTQEKIQPNYYNYYLGNIQSKWQHGIHPSKVVNYKNLYEGISMKVYSDMNRIKYDLVVEPNIDPAQINLKYNGIEKMYLKDEKLVLSTSLGEQVESKPYTYQFINDEKVEIPCEYVLNGDRVSFKISKKYNPNYKLIIDPTLVFCSFTGSTADNWGYTATYDSLGNLYAGGIVGYQTGTSFTGNYPTTLGAFQLSFGGGGTGGMGNQFQYDASLSKFSSNGTTLIYSTYLGGTDNDQPQSMIVDHDDNLVIAGRTYSINYPTSVGAYDVSYNGGGDMFVTKFSPTGALIGSTFVGGSGIDAVNVSADELVITPNDLKHNYSDDARSEVIVDPNNNIYVTAASTSSNFPMVAASQNTIGGMQDAVIIELNPTCTNLLWGTYLGGTQNDAGYAICINKINPQELYVAGGTMSAGLATNGSALHSSYQGGIDGFLFKFNTVTKVIMAGTYIGTNAYDQVYGVQTDDSNRVYIMGQTQGAYPVSAGVYSNPNSSQFITILNNSLSTILKSTVFGTGTTLTTDIAPNAFLVDKCRNVYMSGWGGPIIGSNPGSTFGLPVTANALKSTTDGSDFYFIVLSTNLSGLLYGSFFGQDGSVGEHVDGGTSRFDENGIIYQAICARCGNAQTASTIVFPTTPGVWSPLNQASNCNLAALKIKFDFQNPQAQAVIVGDTVSCNPTVTFLNNSVSAANFIWNFGDGTPTSTALNPTHTYAAPGNYVVTLFAYNPNGCTATDDTTTLNIHIKADSLKPNFTYTKIDSCGPFKAIITNTSTLNTGSINAGTTYLWNFGDGTTSTDPNPGLHPFPTSTSYTITLTMTDTNACNSPATITKVIDFSTSFVKASFNIPDSVCMPANVVVSNQSVSATNWIWTFGDGNTSSIQNPSNNYLTPGEYTIKLISLNPATCNKKDSISKKIIILGSPIADFTWSPNPPEPNKAVELTNKSIGASRYLWEFGDGATSSNKDETHIYQKDGTYNVCLTAYNEVGCKDSVCKPVRGVVIPLADVPSGFSPNGDGRNDIVYVKGYGIQNMTFRIYNRWGELIFESKDKKVGWDGKYKGQLQEVEVYQYTLSVDFFDGTNTFKKGNITLLR